MKILCLSAYEAASHQMWRGGLQSCFSDWEWTTLTLPARNFAWRRRSNPLAWWADAHETLSADFDVVIATSMVDCATLRGLFPTLCSAKWVTYFHENQFEYPSQPGKGTAPDILIQEIYSAICADHVVFNTEFNRTSYLDGVERFLRKMPDRVPPNLIKHTAQKSSVIPVGIDDVWFQPHDAPRSPHRVLWNHRWEWDKGPELLVETVSELEKQSSPFEFVICGQSFHDRPQAFAELDACSNVAHIGTIESREAYVETVRGCGIVLSTALHDFQGLSILESIAAGCQPCVPNRLAYPEYVPDTYQYDAERGVKAITEKLRHLTLNDAPPIDVERFRWASVAEQFSQLLQS